MAVYISKMAATMVGPSPVSVLGPYKGGPLYVINRKINDPICHKQKSIFSICHILSASENFICLKQFSHIP